MEDFKNQLVKINKGFYSDEQLVSFFELIASKLDIGSVAYYAETRRKSDRGIRISNRFKKIDLNGSLVITDKIRESNLPF